MWWYLAWFQLLVQDLKLHSKINATVYKEVLKKHVAPNLRTAINQLYLCKITLHALQWSLLRHFFLRGMLLLKNSLLKAQTWILLRIFGSFSVVWSEYYCLARGNHFVARVLVWGKRGKICLVQRGRGCNVCVFMLCCFLAECCKALANAC